MAKNYVQPGDTLTYKNVTSAVIYSGSVVSMGDIVAIAIADIPAGASGTVHTEKVWKLPSGISSAVAAGTRVYWDTAGKQVVSASGPDIVEAGVAAADAAAGDKSINVKINA